MSENVIWLKRPSAGNDSTRRKDRNVSLVEAIFQFVVSHPFTDGDAVEPHPGMTTEDASLLADVIALGLRIAAQGPTEFEAWASKDMAYYEHWLRHYQKQVGRFLEG